MKNLQEIKNTYAIEQGFADWEQLLRKNYWNDGDIELHWTEICIRAQRVALEKAADYLQQCSCSDYQSQKRQITNPENLIR